MTQILPYGVIMIMLIIFFEKLNQYVRFEKTYDSYAHLRAYILRLRFV